MNEFYDTGFYNFINNYVRNGELDEGKADVIKQAFAYYIKPLQRSLKISNDMLIDTYKTCFDIIHKVGIESIPVASMSTLNSIAQNAHKIHLEEFIQSDF